MVCGAFVRGPSWFFGVDGILEALLFIIALVLAVYAWKCYKLTKGRQYGWFSLAFLAITIAQLSRALTDGIIEFNLRTAGVGSEGSNLPILSDIFCGGYGTHILLLLGGLVILVAVAMRMHDKRIPSLLYALTLPLILLSSSIYVAFYFVQTVLSAFIAFSYFQHWWKKKKTTLKTPSFFVFLGFTLIMLASFLFLADAQYNIWYVKAHIVQLLGYTSLLLAFIWVHRS